MTWSARPNSALACSRYSLIFCFPSGVSSDFPNSNNAASGKVMTFAANAVTLTVVDAVPDPPVAVIVYCVELPGQTCLDPLGSTFPTLLSISTVDAFVDDQVRFVH